MSPRICSCVLCGLGVYDWPGEVSWLNLFRGLYSDVQGVVLTGVGLYSDAEAGEFIAPPSREARWDDPGYENPIEDRFGAMHQREINGRHGFVFHEACWRLLEKAFEPTPVPHVKLFEICNSLPYPMQATCISWGHDYEGIATIDRENFFPWEDSFTPIGSDEPDPISDADPTATVEVISIVASTQLEPSPAPDTALNATTEPRDLFGSLPLEIRTAIARKLSTQDALRLRLASKAFWPLFYSQQFWASRFEISDRSWFFDYKYLQLPQDWRAIYRHTNDKRLRPGLQNRKRIWKLIAEIQNIMEAKWTESAVLPTNLEADLTDPRWIEVTADLWEETADRAYSMFHNGCRRFHQCGVPILAHIAKLSISYIEAPDAGYVSGIKITALTGEVVQVGYWTSAEYSVELSSFTGLELAVGSRGIQALRCPGAGDYQSLWLGRPKDAAITERLAVLDQAELLLAGFDVCQVRFGERFLLFSFDAEAFFQGFKLVSLAVRQRNAFSKQGGLAVRALWHPEPPSTSLCLNESMFTPLQACINGFKPIFWTHFGGPSGVLLRHLIKISVIYIAGVRCIDFVYDAEAPSKHERLGRWKLDLNCHIVDFTIDGPGGELVDSIEIRTDHYETPRENWSTDEGSIMSCKFSTNWGRSCDVPEDLEESSQLSRDVISVTADSVITGLYATQRLELGLDLTALGVTSEAAGSMYKGTKSQCKRKLTATESESKKLRPPLP